MKKMDQRQTWRYLAKKWDKPERFYGECIVHLYKDYNSFGLCNSLKCLYLDEQISSKVRESMRELMFKHRPHNSRRFSTYWWRNDLTGAKQRAEFCRKMAKICYKKG